MSESKLTFQYFKEDFAAGLVVFLVALPLCLGIALASGAPLFAGIISGIVGGLVTAGFSRSALSVSGPAAGLTVIVFGAIQSLGSYPAFLLAVLLAGALQIVLGYMRAGIIGYYFPSSVIKGMLAAIGIILIIKQLPHAIGFNSSDFEDEALFEQGNGKTVFQEALSLSNFIAPGAAIIGILSMAVMVFWEKLSAKGGALRVVPGALLAVVLGIVINQLYGLIKPEWMLEGNNLVELPIFTNAQVFFSSFTLPDFHAFSNPMVYKVGATIAIVASIETLLSVEATDKLDPMKRVTPNNRELKAQGLGNMVSALIGGLPLTAVIVRSSANINAGGKTRLSAVIHGALLLICVVSIPALLNMIPLACLAAILLLVGYKLAKVSLFKEMYQLGKRQFLPFMVTVIVIQFTDLLIGITAGVIVSAIFILLSNYRLGYHFIKEKYENGERILIRLAENVTFLNKGNILLKLDELPANSTVVIDGSNSHHIDHDVLELLHNFKARAGLRNIKLEFIKVPDFKPVSLH